MTSSLEPEIEKTEEFVAVNANEDLVRDSVVSMMGYMDMCSCSKCVSDACALVLNQLPPQYVTTRKGQLLSQLPKLTVDNQIDMTVKVIKALRMVRESPQHKHN